jgi:SAM-dependent methyltransferase
MIAYRNAMKNDGFIIQSNDTYWLAIILKWKEFILSSIDLLYFDKKLYYKEGDKCHLIEKYVIENMKSIKNLRNHDIVELVPLDKKEDTIEFKYLKIRGDKNSPNSQFIWKDTMDIMNDQIDISQLKGETIHFMKYLMRQRSNWLYKRFLHNNWTILEMGSGDGRSSKMWRNLNLKVYCVEPNKTSFNELSTRSNIVDKINTGGQDPLIRNWIPHSTVDAIMMIHSLTFFFESSLILQQLFDNIKWALKPNGILIICTVDGNHFKEDIDCKAYSLRLKPPNKVTLTMKNRFTLVDEQDEYIVNIDQLIEVANLNGLHVIFKQPYTRDNRLDAWTNLYYTAGISLVFKLFQ